MREPTKRNHINPCFWTAFWNIDYYAKIKAGLLVKSVRKQKVYSLEFNCPKIMYKKVDDLHYVEGLGLAIVDKNELKHHSKIVNIIGEEDDVGYIIDIENHFSLIENNGGYSTLKKVILNDSILSDEDRAYLSTFIVFHRLRSPLYFQYLISQFQSVINPKLRALQEFKATISDEHKIASEVVPLYNSKWTLYVVDEYTFPLSDSPIIKSSNIVWVVVSPKHLIEIDISKKFTGAVKCKREIQSIKLATLKKLIVESAFQGLIFTDEKMLLKIQKSRTWKSRSTYLKKLKAKTKVL